DPRARALFPLPAAVHRGADRRRPQALTAEAVAHPSPLGYSRGAGAGRTAGGEGRGPGRGHDQGECVMRRREGLPMVGGGGVGAGFGVPTLLRRAWAQTPIKIGMPAALSGAYAQYGIQAKRAAELFSKDIKAKGVLGRPVEFIYEDTAG